MNVVRMGTSAAIDIEKEQIFDISQSRAETTEFKFYVHSNSKHSNTGTYTPNQFESMKHSKMRNKKKCKHVHKKKKKKHQKKRLFKIKIYFSIDKLLFSITTFHLMGKLTNKIKIRLIFFVKIE